MQTLSIPNDIHVFGKQVTGFPLGIAEAFDELVRQVEGGFSRSFYGVCGMINGGFKYYATAEEKYPGEAEKSGNEKLTIGKGDYLFVTVNDWRSKTDTIKDIFETIMQDKRADNQSPIVEWYKNKDEMLCMQRCLHQSA